MIVSCPLCREGHVWESSVGFLPDMGGDIHTVFIFVEVAGMANAVLVPCHDPAAVVSMDGGSVFSATCLGTTDCDSEFMWIVGP